MGANKTPPLSRGGVKFGLVPVSPVAAESAASAAEALSPVAVAWPAVKPAISAVVALGGLKRKLRDVHSALCALETERRYIMHLALGSVLIVHSWFA
jgi:hypothetical protein